MEIDAYKKYAIDISLFEIPLSFNSTLHLSKIIFIVSIHEKVRACTTNRFSLWLALTPLTQSNLVRYVTFTVPLHFGYLEQPQNSLPELLPFLDTLRTIESPHLEQDILFSFSLTISRT